jgi:5-methylcytosine-specific restriction endonuclease McrA
MGFKSGKDNYMYGVSGEKHPRWKGKFECTCELCNEKFYVHYYRKDTAKYCSRKCHNKVNLINNIKNKVYKGKKGKDNSNWKGGDLLVRCETCGDTVKRRVSLIKRYKHVFCSSKCWGVWYSENKSGENHYNWQGGKSKNQRDLHNLKYTTWRTNVFKKHNYTCQICGNKGGYLHAHHIKRWADYPELRFDINNGMTICRKCHYNIRRDTPLFEVVI